MKPCLHPNSDGLFIPLAFPYSVLILLAESNIFLILIPASVEYLYSSPLFGWTDWQDSQ